jgi:AraC family transcriptional regulator
MSATTRAGGPPRDPKYGAPLTNEAWAGWPLRVGHFPGQGVVEGLFAVADTVLVWSGGVSEVSVHTGRTLQTFTRRGGMVDLLPAGITIDQIHWRGEATGCTSAVLPRAQVQSLLGAGQAGFEADAGLRLGITDSHVVDLVLRLQAQALESQPWGKLYVEALSLTLASYVYGRYARHTPLLADGVGLAQGQTEQLIAFIEDNIGNAIALAELAHLVGYSPAHFSRLFKRTFGMSPHQYILARRVERAKAMLKHRSRSILEVALACGFASQAHLNAAFKLRTGVTPGVYRRS